MVDETGLKGAYDFELTLERDAGPAPTLVPPLFSALREQLGLKLESGKARVEFLVVDHAEQPTEN
ncbi:MAG: TIGR03435 family protein [Candidatus Sulfopaludibacter sp.]|nr:TIGR03435 family protein [Candidatus Sulfopaludibacter sp.]